MLNLHDIFKLSTPSTSISSIRLDKVDNFYRISFTSPTTDVTGTILFTHSSVFDIHDKIGIPNPPEFIKVIKNIGPNLRLEMTADYSISLTNTLNGMCVIYPILQQSELPKISVLKDEIINSGDNTRIFTGQDVQSIINMLSAVSDCANVIIEIDDTGEWSFSAFQSESSTVGGKISMKTESVTHDTGHTQCKLKLSLKLLLNVLAYSKKFKLITFSIYSGIVLCIKYEIPNELTAVYILQTK